MYSLIALYIYLYFKLTYFLLLHLPLVRIACMYMQRSMQHTLAHKANTMARNGTQWHAARLLGTSTTGRTSRNRQRNGTTGLVPVTKP